MTVKTNGKREGPNGPSQSIGRAPSENRLAEPRAERAEPRWRRLLLVTAVTVWSLIVYAAIALGRDLQLAPELQYLVLQPFLWLSLAGVAFSAWCLGFGCRPQASARLVLAGALVGGFQVACWLLAGLVFGFGHSLFASSPIGLLGNLLQAGCALLALELTRAVLVAGHRQRTIWVLLGTALLTTGLRVPPARWAAALETGAVGPLIGEMLLPYFAENLLASSLALSGGPLPALVYRGLPQAFQWFSPILPQLPWTASAFVGTLAPALGLVLLQSDTAPNPMRQARGFGGAWPIAGTALVALLWLNVGLFGVRPTLVSGSSMEPELQTGDIALVREFPANEITVGDVIQFRHEGVQVIHRVVEVHRGSEGLVFTTKGDANNQLDPLLPAERLDGKVVFVIRKVGWIGIAVRQAIQWLHGSAVSSVGSLLQVGYG